ncbi:MAG: UvrD-helicase domain-containing protein [Caldimonas sp.]
MIAPAPAFRVDGKPVARAAFYAAACDPQRSCVVEACAGSGKTWMLVSRILRALLDGAAPHEILAITFTRAAAGEMRNRLDEWLAEFAGPRATHAKRVEALVARGLAAGRAEALAPHLATLQARVLAAGRPVEIRTFHGWFAQLMRSSPLVLLDRLGLQPHVELVEDWDEHRPAVMRAFHASVLADPALRADHAALTAARGRSQLRAWLDATWNKRVEFELADAVGVLEGSVESAADTWPELAGVAEPVDLIAGHAWRECLCELASELDSGGANARRAAAGLVVACNAASPAARYAAAWSALFTQDGKRRVLAAGSQRLADVHDALELLAAQIHQQDSRDEHLRMVRLGRALLAAVAAYKREQGLADMPDLERVALELLRDGELSGWVQERLDASIAHFLVDEFQDTSPLQWHALHGWLAAYAGAGGGASGQRPPGVFIVGDPKQSIYRFRRAEPLVFAEATRFVRDGLEGTVLACDHTRRNAPRVIDAINAVFAPLASTGSFAGFRTHTTEVADDPGADVQTLARTPRPPRAARAGSGASVAPVWRDSLTVPRLEVEEVLREQEAETVAVAIRQLVDTGTQPGEIYVLCRKRESLRLVATALEHEHVAHSAVEAGTLAESPEAQDLIALVDALVSPAHRLSLARALRSPIFSVSDADLLAIAAAADDGDWWRALFVLASPSPALARARELLHRWHALARELPPHDLLDRVVHEGDVHARTAAAVPPEQRALAIDAIDAVLAQALLLDGGRYATPYGFVRALKRRSIKAAAPVHADAVRLLTIHGAKGLEADTVFVMDSDPESPRTETTTLLVEWPVEVERPTRCAFVYAETRCPVSLRPTLASEQRAREREELNSLYVAMSRARRRLVFSATEPYLVSAGVSWWGRIAPVASLWSWATEVPRSLAPGAYPGVALVKTLPAWQKPEPAAPPLPLLASQPDASAARLGRAVHRALEWAGRGQGIAIDALASAAAREFDVAEAAVRHHVEAILCHADGARFFAGPQIRWSGDEVSVSDAGEVLRIDRLVLLDDGSGPVWWVLDYKLRHAPEELEPYRQQLRRYRGAVERAQAGENVRCAFVTGTGKVVEID